MKNIHVDFWGVRGSVPSPGPTTARYGGNTSCVSITIDNKILILDAGTGIRNLGSAIIIVTTYVDRARPAGSSPVRLVSPA